MKEKKKEVYKLFFAVVLLAFGFGGLTFATTQASDPKISLPLVYSHRGASKEEIEHTFPAYDLAIMYGSKYIEQDVVTSKDGTLFVSHDLSAKRITGVNKLYSKMSDKEIGMLKTKNGDKILTLQDVFSRYKDSVNYVVELKENARQVDSFVKLVRQNKLEKNIIVQATKIDALIAVDKTFKNMKKLLLVSTQSQLNKAVKEKAVDIVSVQKKLMNSKNIIYAYSKGKVFNAWTLDSSIEIEDAIGLKVDSFFTDFTAMALTLEKSFYK